MPLLLPALQVLSNGLNINFFFVRKLEVLRIHRRPLREDLLIAGDLLDLLPPLIHHLLNVFLDLYLHVLFCVLLDLLLFLLLPFQLA